MKPQKMWAVVDGGVIYDIAYRKRDAIELYEEDGLFPWSERSECVKAVKVIVSEVEA